MGEWQELKQSWKASSLPFVINDTQVKGKQAAYPKKTCSIITYRLRRMSLNINIYLIVNDLTWRNVVVKIDVNKLLVEQSCLSFRGYEFHEIVDEKAGA